MAVEKRVLGEDKIYTLSKALFKLILVGLGLLAIVVLTGLVLMLIIPDVVRAG